MRAPKHSSVDGPGNGITCVSLTLAVGTQTRAHSAAASDRPPGGFHPLDHGDLTRGMSGPMTHSHSRYPTGPLGLLDT